MALREVMVVVQKGDHSLGYYDFETGRELGRVGVDPFPHEFTLSSDGRVAYLVDTVAGIVIRSISTRSDPDPMAVVSLDM